MDDTDLEASSKLVELIALTIKTQQTPSATFLFWDWSARLRQMISGMTACSAILDIVNKYFMSPVRRP